MIGFRILGFLFLLRRAYKEQWSKILQFHGSKGMSDHFLGTKMSSVIKQSVIVEFLEFVFELLIAVCWHVY